MQSETTKKQRITIGILCIPFALAINACILLGIYRLVTSDFNVSIFNGLVMLILILLGFLFTRSAYMLLRYPNGSPNKYLIHPYIVFGLCVLAFAFCLITLLSLISLELISLLPEFYSNQKDFKFGKAIAFLFAPLPALAYAIKVQYQKILITRRLTRTAAAQPLG